MTPTKNQHTIKFESKIEDAIQTLRIKETPNITLKYNQVITILVKEALKARGIQF